MDRQTVKQKLVFRDIFGRSQVPAGGLFLLWFALLSFIVSVVPALHAGSVERWYSRLVYPKISAGLGFLANAVPFAWLDVLLLAAILYIGVCIRRRRWLWLAYVIAAGYILFFWSWGLNYRRQPLATKLTVDSEFGTPEAMEQFSRQVAEQLNGLYDIKERIPYNEDAIAQAAASRVALVVERLDGTRWVASGRVKDSVLANPWFRAAGIDGVFDPIIHEPIVSSAVLSVERPFVMAHEMAHVRGYPDEGDANYVALMATLLSAAPRLQYSGWLELWFYLRSPAVDSLLQPGPRHDVQAVFERDRRDRIRLISNFQSTILDLFLKANNVAGGVRSYERVALLAAETRNDWERFR